MIPLYGFSVPQPAIQTHFHSLPQITTVTSMSQPVAIITGGASGIGLAVTKHLLAAPYNYKVVIADQVPESVGTPLADSLGPNCLFHRTDVSNYAQQAAVFAKAFEWGGSRLDFLAANAGIDDRESLYSEGVEVELEGGVKGPRELNLKTMRVDFDAVIQGLWLFKWWNAKGRNKGDGRKVGKVVITSSAAGL